MYLLNIMIAAIVIATRQDAHALLTKSSMYTKRKGNVSR
jgi:hypothetical protein